MGTIHNLPKRARRLTAAAAATAVLAVGLAIVPSLSASAHIRVSAQQVAPGGTAQLTFTVPNETTTSVIVIVEVDVPISTPVPDALLQSVPGWTGRVTKAPLGKSITVNGREFTSATQRITWTSSADQGIAPGAFQQFAVAAGPLPDVPKIALTALQTYSDGEVVRWDGADTDHPAPTLYVTGTPPATTSMSGMGMTGSPAAATVADQRASADPVPMVLSEIALVLALLSVGMVLWFGLRGRIVLRSKRADDQPESSRDRETADESAGELIGGDVR